MDEDFFFVELLDSVPAHARDRVAHIVLTAKYAALVEAVMKLTGGQPVELDLERVKEIAAMSPRTTPPEEFVMVAERKPDREPGPRVLVDLATVDEVRAANRRFALSQMGARRN